MNRELRRGECMQKAFDTSAKYGDIHGDRRRINCLVVSSHRALSDVSCSLLFYVTSHSPFHAPRHTSNDSVSLALLNPQQKS